MSERIRFGEFEFSPDSGELRRFGNGESGVERLRPLPARLLTLLLRNEGDVLTRDEIRKQLWPDVSVDFDSNLHFCVRQVRAALDDSAAEPRYIETLPRRGYRLITPVDAARPSAMSRRGWILAALTLVVASAGIWMFNDRGASHAERVLRIGIMPFRPFGSEPAAQGAGIAEWILEELMARGGERVELIGPTSTEGYRDDAASLKRLAEEHRLDFIVNGRFVSDETGPSMLAELIRLPDGAHIWVKRYRTLDDVQRIGQEISGNVFREAGLVE